MEDPKSLYKAAGDQLVEAVQAIPDPWERIRAVKELIEQGGLIHGRLAAVTRDTVRHLHDHDGLSYTAIGDELGVTRARAEQLAKGRS
jgi:hypothetical protein